MRTNVEHLRELYPSGTRDKLTSKLNDPQPIQDGNSGTVRCVDGIGQRIMKWYNCRSLALIPGVDSFVKIQ